MARTGSVERVPFPDLSQVLHLRIATSADVAVLCRIDASANRWAWRHGTAARARACAALAALPAIAAVLGVVEGDLGLTMVAIGLAAIGVPLVAAATHWDIRSGIRRTLAGSRRIVVLSEDETAFLTLARGVSRGRPHWVIGRHAAVRVGAGHGARLRARVWGPLLAQADAQAITIAALVPVRLESRLIDELPGARRSGRLPFGRQVERKPQPTPR